MTHRVPARGRRLRRAGADAVHRASHADAATRGRHDDAVDGRRDQLANVRWSALFDDVELTPPRSPAWPRRPVRSCGRAASGWRSTTPTWRPRRRPSPSGPHDPAHRRRDAAPRPRPRRQPAGRWRHHRGQRLGRRPARAGRAVDASRADAPEGSRASCAATRPRPSPGSGSSTPPGSAAASPSTWVSARPRRCWPTCWPTRATGATLVVAPPAVVGNWAAEAAGSPPTCGSSCTTARPGLDRELAEAVDGADVVITTYGTAVRDIEALAEVEWGRVMLDEAQAIKNPANDTAQQLRRIPARSRLALTGTPIENGLGDLWAILDFTNPGLVGGRGRRSSPSSRRTARRARRGRDRRCARSTASSCSAAPRPSRSIAAELPDRIDELDHCTMTPEQIGLYQAVLDTLVVRRPRPTAAPRRARSWPPSPPSSRSATTRPPTRTTTCRSPALGQAGPPRGDRRVGVRRRRTGAVFTHFAAVGRAAGRPPDRAHRHAVACYHGGLARRRRDRMIDEFQAGEPARARWCCR